MMTKEQCPPRLAEALDNYMRTEFDVPFMCIPQMFKNHDGDRIMLVELEDDDTVGTVMEDYPGHLVQFRLQLGRNGTIETL